MISSQHRQTSYFVENPVIALPVNLDADSLTSFVNDYNISYIVLDELNGVRYRDNHFLMDLYHKYEIGDFLEVDKKILTLVHISEGEKYDLLIYGIDDSG